MQFIYLFIYVLGGGGEGGSGGKGEGGGRGRGGARVSDFFRNTQNLKKKSFFFFFFFEGVG